jgi:hypothetical protein
LLPGGWLLVEHGWTQGEAVRALFTQAGYAAVETCRDYGGNERLTLGQWHEPVYRATYVALTIFSSSVTGGATAIIR